MLAIFSRYQSSYLSTLAIYARMEYKAKLERHQARIVIRGMNKLYAKLYIVKRSIGDRFVRDGRSVIPTLRLVPSVRSSRFFDASE